MQRTQHLLRSTILVIVIFGLNKITGFAKLLLMTAAFGASPQADAFTSANQLPELFDSMLASGALAAALIPVYSAALLKGGRRDATALANTVLTLMMLVLGSVSGVAALFAVPITQQFLVPDFAPAQQVLTAELMRILLLAMMVYGMGSVLSSLLHAHQHFLTPALGTVVLDLGQAAGLYFLAPRWGIEGVAWGSVIGALLFWGVQIPVFLRRQIANRLQLALRLASLRELGHLMWPRVITLGVVQAVDLIFIRLASQLPGGSISAHAYAMLIMVNMPKSLFAAAISTVVFPTLAEQHNRGDNPNFSRTIQRALQAVWALTIPGALGLLALGEPAVAFLLQRGAFDARATTLVYTLLAIFSLRLVAEATQDILALPFYARHNTRIAMWISLGWMVLNIGLSYLLVGPFGIHGLAWAATVAVTAATLVLYWLNRRAPGNYAENALLRSLVHILVACACMVGVILLLHWFTLDGLPFLVAAIGLGGLTYFGVYTALGGRELQTVFALLVPTQWVAKRKRLVIPDPASSGDSV